MRSSAVFLNPAEAARQLGVSAKALRLYERHGLLRPPRSAAGWRAYGPAEMARAGEIAALRALGLSLAQVARVLRGEPEGLESALAMQQERLEGQIRHLAATVERLRALRAALAQGQAPSLGELARLMRPEREVRLAFALPWPWGGDRFELRALPPLTYITGPLGSGKTRLARAIADHLPGAAFIGLERAAEGNAGEGGAEARARLAGEPALRTRVERSLTWLLEEGAEPSPALLALLVALESDGPTALVIDLVEQGLSPATQEALGAFLRRRGPTAPPLFLLTRSTAILDLTAAGPETAILLCPANHSPPLLVAPYPGAPGYEAVATCLAAPEVRARTEGVVAMRPAG